MTILMTTIKIVYILIKVDNKNLGRVEYGKT